MRVERQTDDLILQLKEQVYFLMTSARLFDEGNEVEYKKLTVPIRTIVYDTGNMTSLLKQLGKKEILFLDTASAFNPTNLAPSNCLTIMKLSTSSGCEYVAPLGNLSPARANKKIPFDQWWQKNIICKDNQANTFTRSDLVLNVAQTDGGVHIDPKLKADYVALAKENSMGWTWASSRIQGGIEMSLGNPVPPSIRQIAYELLVTLRDEFPSLLGGD